MKRLLRTLFLILVSSVLLFFTGAFLIYIILVGIRGQQDQGASIAFVYGAMMLVPACLILGIIVGIIRSRSLNKEERVLADNDTIDQDVEYGKEWDEEPQ